MLGSTEFEIADIVALRDVRPDSLNTEADSECDLIIYTFLANFQSALLVDFANSYCISYNALRTADAAFLTGH